MEALIINFVIFIIIVLCLLGIKKRYFDEQHPLEDPLYKEVFDRQMEEGRKIRDKSRKEYEEYLDSTLDYRDDAKEWKEKLKDEDGTS